MRPLAVLTSLGLLVTPALSQEPPDAAEIGAIFCAASLAGDMAPVQDLLTPDLAETIAAALARNDEIQAATPDEKPPLGDGVPWASWPDKPDTCDTEVTEAYDGAAMVNVTYGFTDAPDANYTDTLVLMQGDAGWAIDDVVLVDNHTLRGLIETVFDH